MGTRIGLLRHHLACSHISDLWGMVMKLLDMLVSELPALGGLPNGAKWIHQSQCDGELYFYDGESNLMSDFRGVIMSSMAEDSPEITREEYISAIAKKLESGDA
ncbi:MAG: hypothetical protein [Bacteriophage sp.]|nr:MAG: hypothetical protein [Bacteriophage sp.]